jgi:hypothetical protein
MVWSLNYYFLGAAPSAFVIKRLSKFGANEESLLTPEGRIVEVGMEPFDKKDLDRSLGVDRSLG